MTFYTAKHGEEIYYEDNTIDDYWIDGSDHICGLCRSSCG